MRSLRTTNSYLVMSALITLAALEAAAHACQTKNDPFAWSCHGPIDGMDCILIQESADLDTWSDNYFCSASPLGLKWSSHDPIPGLNCTQIIEPADPDTWLDNYLCYPDGTGYSFIWSYHGPVDGRQCLQWLEPADPDTWHDNYLCW